MSQCKKFSPNIFHKTKCSNCFRQKEEHTAEALECNRASRSIARSGYLFVAPDWDFSVPLNRTKRWQRRWFVLYDDGELNYSVDEHPDTVPQGSVDMCKVLEVTGAEQVTGHPHSLALTSPDRVTFVKAASREDARWWAELLAVFPRRHKRNATFPGGRASPSLPQLGRSASPQPPRPRHLSVTGPSPRANFETPPLKEERESPPKEEQKRPGWLPVRTGSMSIQNVTSPIRSDSIVSSGSPPTRDKLRCDDKIRARRDWRNERLRDIATALTDRSPESSLALPAEGLLNLKKAPTSTPLDLINLLQGWLWVKNNSSEFVRRWIVLCGPTLQIYQDQNEQGTPELTVELSTVTNYTEIPTDSKYGFEIQWDGNTMVLSAVTQGIRSNWLHALKKAAPITVESSITPPTPRSVMASSDEEYRTASEGGRRGSEDWSELPPSPPPNRLSISRVKDRTRLRPRLPRCQSRQSTLDSTSTDELDCAKENEFPSLNSLNRNSEDITEIQKKLTKAEEAVRTLEEEIARLKKFQSDAAIREKKTKEMLSNFERNEIELNQKNSQIEVQFLKEQRALQRRLSEAEESSRTLEEKCNILSKELQTKQRIITDLKDELSSSNERVLSEKDENDKLYKKIQELEGRYCFKNSKFHVDTLTELTNINLDLDIDDLNHNELNEYCLDLKCRFEKAIMEIRAVKKALRESHEECDKLEITNFSLNNSIKIMEEENQAEIKLLVARLDHLTSKLNAAEKQLKIKSKADSKEKRRSLSLKGRESFSINKEVEDKVTELEAKILALERSRNRRRYKRERSSERGSPIDDKSLRRLRRKSLDSATSSEPMKLLIRLSSLETKVTNVNASNESLNLLNSNSTPDLRKLKEESTESGRSNIDVEYLISAAKIKVSECLSSVSILRSSRKRATSPSIDRLASLENALNELQDILHERDCMISSAEAEVINSSADAAVKQLQRLLLEKLTSISEKKRLLRENNKLDNSARLQLLAEKIAYENILVSRIQEALQSPVTGEAVCDRLMNKETKETAYLIIDLQNKITGTNQKQPPSCRTSADYLSKVLSKCLISATRGFNSCKNFIAAKGPSMSLLYSEKEKLDALLDAYKANKLPQLAEALATDTINLASDKTCRIRSLTQETVNEFSKTAREVVNAELIQSEINHVLHRAAQIYQANIDQDHTYFFSFFASERAALELWEDSVGECLFEEINTSINELTEQYLNCLNKLQKQNWRRRVELERNSRTPTSMLHEFADIIAHKALIDARIVVLSGKYTIPEDGGDSNADNLSSWLENERHWTFLEDQSLVQINQSLEAEFYCMLDKYSSDCFALLGQPELEEVLGYLDEVTEKVLEVQKCIDVPVARQDLVVKSWADVCQKCIILRNNLEDIRNALERPIYKRNPSLNEQRPVYLGTEYLTQVENLRAAYRHALASCRERHRESDIEQLQQLCERVLVAMEQWHCRTIHELREAHAQEVEILKQEKEQALAEETQATLAALDAMKKAHVAEVQREIAKFKQEYARQQRDDIFDLSEKLSVKSLEAAALEEQLGSAARQLAHAQQHILQLERNPQLSSAQN